jgi:hypothetical protein
MSASRKDLARLAVLAPAAAALITLESRTGWWPLRFPRGLEDLERDPSRLFDLLTVPSHGLLAPIADPSRARLVTQTRAGRLTNEPDKNRTTGRFDLTLEENGAQRTVPVLAKFQSGRGMPLYMQAIRAVFEYRFAREIEFYRRLAPVVPVAVPRPLFADSVTLLNRVCLVLERLDGDTVADWRGCALPAMRALLSSAARLNGAFVGRVSTPAAAWIPARAGLEFASYVDGFIAKREDWYRRVWAALGAYFAGQPVTLVHGDCRPGNMLFRGVAVDAGEGGEDHASRWPDGTPDPDAAVMCDWEAVNVAPLLWDFTYCTVSGLRVADRHAWQGRLLEEFLDHLDRNGVAGRELARDRAPLDVQLLAIVLAYVAFVISDHGLWSGQGNTPEDIRAWSRRVLDGAATGDTQAIAGALRLPLDDVRRLQEHFHGRQRAQ